MGLRSRTLSTAGHHQHCDKCHNLNCQVPVQVSISCTIIKCRKNCGASFHLCKQEDHCFLCPNETVPCINASFGCPQSMPRFRLTQHLRSCPASVVCCSQEWNRWDQDRLFRSIKMKSVFPELMVNDSVPEACASYTATNPHLCEDMVENSAEMELSQEEIDALAKCGGIENIHKYSSWEKMFKKEMDGCKETVKNLDQKQKREEEKEVHISEYNMYLVHNACTPREKDFVYGNLEPIEVKTVRSFKVPTSYRAKRSHLKDPSKKVKTAHQCIDTAELGVSIKDLPKFDEVPMTLLCALEKELKGHSISQSTATDAMDDNEGTQTYDFHLAPFQSEASLADIASNDNSLFVNIETESVTRRHNKSSSAFTYICGHFFKRDEFSSHFKNVHADIQSCLNGWFQQRCPLAYLGCTYTQTRFHPSGQQATIKYCQDVDTLALQPQAFSSSNFCQSEEKITKMDHLSRLPLEVLQYIASHLMRDVCSTLLPERGMVFLKWEKKMDSNGGSAWRCWKKVWTFSFVFSTVDKWSFSDTPSMSEHLKSCPYYYKEKHSEPVALPCLGEVIDRLGAACPRMITPEAKGADACLYRH
uniref:F-box protein 40 n=1 Tax=Neogobius melanostomus TaxID=47308 RepID=A0A8C6WEC7_9GOBI